MWSTPPPISFGVPWRVRGSVNSGMISTTMEDCGNVAAPWVTFESKKKKEKKKVFFSHVVQGCAKEDASWRGLMMSYMCGHCSVVNHLKVDILDHLWHEAAALIPYPFLFELVLGSCMASYMWSTWGIPHSRQPTQDSLSLVNWEWEFQFYMQEPFPLLATCIHSSVCSSLSTSGISSRCSRG